MPLKFKHFFKGFRHPEKIIKQIPSLLGAAAGTALLGPAGGILGGTLGGTTTRGKGNKLKGALHGAGMGALYSAAAPMLHSAISGPAATSQGLFSSASGINAPSLLHQLGMKSAPGIGGGIGLWGNLGEKGAVPNLFDKVSGKAAAGKSLLGGKGLLAAAAPFVKSALPKVKQGLGLGSQGGIGQVKEEPSYQPAHGGGYEGESDFFPGHPLGSTSAPQGRGRNEAEDKKNVNKIINNPNLSAMEKLMQLAQYLGLEPDHFTGKEFLAQLENSEPKFKRGGHVSGYIRGKEGGQADNRRTRLKEGDFIMDSTSLSLYGDGNSEAGANRFKQEVENRYGKNKYNTYARVEGPSPNQYRYIDAWVSPGEYRVNRDVVTAIGNGNNKAGANILDNFRKNLRAHKGVTKFLPPKSKKFDHYAFGGVI